MSKQASKILDHTKSGSPNGLLSEKLSAKDLHLRPAELKRRIQELQKFIPQIEAVIRKIVYQETDVADLSQDVLVRAIEKLPEFRGEAALGTWLHRIAVNAALMFRRKRKVRMRREEATMDENNLGIAKSPHSVRKKTMSAEAESDRRETRKLLEKAIRKLPKEYRDVLMLADIDDQPNEKIAEKLGLTLPAVKSRLHRARGMMRQQLSPHFEVDQISPPLRLPEDGAV